MKLQKLEIKKLYGFMDKTVEFNEQLNLLVGINGSGKTSVLNVIYWIMQPSYAELCTTEFEHLSLHFLYEEKKHIITCSQTETEVTIKVEINGEELHPLVTKLRYPAAAVPNNLHLKESLFQAYESMQPLPQEIESWTYFLKLPNPVVISIDRKFEQKEIRTSEQKFKPKQVNPYSSSLDTVKKYSNEAYTGYNKKVIDLNKVLRNKILLSSFESSIIDLKESTRNNIKLSTLDVDRLENNFIRFLDEDESTDLETSTALKDSIRQYASDMRNIVNNYNLTRKTKGNKNASSVIMNYLVNSNQFIRIQKLLSDFSNYEENSNNAYKPVNAYLEAVNHFLTDSSKELFFKKEDGQLYFKLKDKDNRAFKLEQSIEGLSSGEKQILILFTYLAFSGVKGKVVIIDEPEISLHPKWQDDFLNQLSKVTPSDTQLIIATHSPSIVGELEANCKILLPYNE